MCVSVHVHLMRLTSTDLVSVVPGSEGNVAGRTLVAVCTCAFHPPQPSTRTAPGAVITASSLVHCWSLYRMGMQFMLWFKLSCECALYDWQLLQLITQPQNLTR